MASCEQPVSEQTTGDALGCGWAQLQTDVGAVVSHPASANVTEWLVTLLALFVLLFFLGMILRRR